MKSKYAIFNRQTEFGSAQFTVYAHNKDEKGEMLMHLCEGKTSYTDVHKTSDVCSTHRNINKTLVSRTKGPIHMNHISEVTKVARKIRATDQTQRNHNINVFVVVLIILYQMLRSLGKTIFFFFFGNVIIVFD